MKLFKFKLNVNKNVRLREQICAYSLTQKLKFYGSFIRVINSLKKEMKKEKKRTKEK